MLAQGMLAIWSDVAPESETDYLHWLTREHAAERVSTAGFLGVRVFRTMDFDIRRYFILYELESPSALSSDDYVNKLNNPTPWSQRIMPTLKNFVRGGGAVIARSGVGRGGFAGAVAIDDTQIAAAELSILKLSSTDRISSACLLKVDNAKTSIATREKDLRRDDKSFGNLLVFDGLDAIAVRSALESIEHHGNEASVPSFVYKQIYQLDRRQLVDV